MADGTSAGEAQPITRESLKPPSSMKRSEWELLDGLNNDPEAGLAADADIDDEAPDEGQEGDESEPKASEATLGRMKLNDFLDAAGVSMEEFYRDVYVELDGKEVSISQAWDGEKSSVKALEALSRERDELQARLNQSAITVPTGPQDPQAMALAIQADECQKVLDNTDWTQFEAAQASAEQLKYINLRDTLRKQAQEKQQKHVQEVQAHYAKAIEEADRQTRSAIPEWNDAKVRAAEWQAIKDLGASYGFKAQEMDAVLDPRTRLMLRDFAKIKQEVATVKAGAKRIRKVGKTLGAGGRDTSKGRPSLEDVSRAIREAPDRHAKSKIRQTMDLPDIKTIKQSTR